MTDGVKPKINFPIAKSLIKMSLRLLLIAAERLSISVAFYKLNNGRTISSLGWGNQLDKHGGKKEREPLTGKRNFLTSSMAWAMRR